MTIEILKVMNLCCCINFILQLTTVLYMRCADNGLLSVNFEHTVIILSEWSHGCGCSHRFVKMCNTEDKDKFHICLPLQLCRNSSRCRSFLALGCNSWTMDGLSSHGNEFSICGSFIVAFEIVSSSIEMPFDVFLSFIIFIVCLFVENRFVTMFVFVQLETLCHNDVIYGKLWNFSYITIVSNQVI